MLLAFTVEKGIKFYTRIKQVSSLTVYCTFLSFGMLLVHFVDRETNFYTRVK